MALVFFFLLFKSLPNFAPPSACIGRMQSTRESSSLAQATRSAFSTHTYLASYMPLPNRARLPAQGGEGRRCRAHEAQRRERPEQRRRRKKSLLLSMPVFGGLRSCSPLAFQFRLGFSLLRRKASSRLGDEGESKDNPRQIAEVNKGLLNKG